MRRQHWRKLDGRGVRRGTGDRGVRQDDDDEGATDESAPAETAGGAAPTSAAGTRGDHGACRDDRRDGGHDRGDDRGHDRRNGGGGRWRRCRRHDRVRARRRRVHGRGDFVLDPADCPEDWDPTQGITDTEITFFSSMPKSGPLAGFGLIADGIQSYFDYINEQGGIDGRQHAPRDQGRRLRAGQDQDQRRRGARCRRRTPALLTIIGTPNNLAVWDVAQRRVHAAAAERHRRARSGATSTNHPWTTGMQLDYSSEAGLWAQWLQAEHARRDEGRRRGVQQRLRQELRRAASRPAIEGTDIEVVEQQFHEPTAPDLTNQFTTMAASGRRRRC